MRPATGILLAAGQGRRFGSNKLLHPLDDGIPLVLHAARTLQAALPHTLVVVNPQDRQSIELIESEGMKMVLNPAADAGMGTSIACGVRASRRAEGWVIVLADMPYLRAQTIRSVAAGIRNRHSICAPRYHDQRGHPVGFGRAYAKALLALSGDEGARHIIAANRQYLSLFATRDPGVVTDIDFREDLAMSSIG